MSQAGSNIPNSGPGSGTVTSVSGGHDIFITGNPAVNPTVNVTNAITLGDLAPIAAGSPALTAVTGDVDISAGNLNMTFTNNAGTEGVINLGDWFIFQSNTVNPNFFIYAGGGPPPYGITGASNLGVGKSVFTSFTSGNSNAIFGNGAFINATTASRNYGQGQGVLQQLVTGSYNCVIGYTAGLNYTGNESSNILLNALGTAGQSNALVIGAGTGTGNQQLSSATISGIYGESVGATNGPVYIDNTGKLGTSGGTPPASSITITGDSGGGLTSNSFTFTGGSTGLTFSGSGTTETLTGALIVANGGTGVSSFNTDGVVISNTTSTGALAALSLTDGQVVIGSSAGVPLAATLTAGAGVSITNGHNSITIATTSAGFTWHDVTGGSATLAAENGYIADSGSLTTLTLPTNNTFGDTIKVVGKGSGGWKIVYGAGQNIIFGSSASTVTTGNIASTNANDCAELVCTTASATAPIFTITAAVGNLSIT